MAEQNLPDGRTCPLGSPRVRWRNAATWGLDLAEERKNSAAPFCPEYALQLLLLLLQSLVLHHVTCQLITLSKLLKLVLSERLPAYSIANAVEAPEDRVDVSQRI